MTENAIITVGLCPCWDITYRINGITWGEHKKISSQTAVPAGKALNISRALDWLGVKSIAAGLWGELDYPQMADIISTQNHSIISNFTVVSGKTRQNTTIVDTKLGRAMHLRAESELATQKSLQQLKKDLDKIVTPTSTVVFAGSMPENFPDECLTLIKQCRDKGAKIVVDTSGPALEKVVKLGGLYLIKPNLEELCQLLGRPVENEVDSIIQAARSLCNFINIVLVSRGADGALAITAKEAFQSSIKERQNVINTVGCGDFLLAGFLSQIGDKDICRAMAAGIKVATARAWGLSEKTSWSTADAQIKVDTLKY